jgi:hypothetical protein
MVESSSSFAVSFLIVIGYYWITEGDLNKALGFTTGVALFFMFPIFTLWSLAGLIAKTRVLKQRLLVNLGVSVAVSVGFTLFLLWVASSSKANFEQAGVSSLIGGSILVGITSIIGGLVTYRFVIDDNKPRLSATAYTSINTLPQTHSPKSKSKTANKPKKLGGK